MAELALLNEIEACRKAKKQARKTTRRRKETEKRRGGEARRPRAGPPLLFDVERGVGEREESNPSRH